MKTPFWLYALSLIPPSALVIIGVAQPWVPPSQLFRDPLQVAQEVGSACCHVYFGFFSNLGVFLWCSAASVCFFASMLLIQRKVDRQKILFMVSAGLLTSLLLFDDIFQGHEVMYPKVLGINEIHVFAVYVILTGLYLSFFRNLIVSNCYPLMLLSIIFFTISILVDLFFPRLEFLEERGIRLVIEDGAKLIGIATWTTFHFRAAWLLCTGDQHDF